MKILLKAAKIVDPLNKELHLKKRDILITNGIIEQIAVTITPPTKSTIVAHKNLHVSIGWFDTGVCFGEPGYEERETIANGLECAAKSGFTDVILNPNAHPLPDSSSDIVFLKNSAKDHLTGLHPLGNLTVKGESESLAELFDMKNSGAVGFYDYKHPITNANLLKIALQYAQNFDATVFSFPLDSRIAGKGVVNEGIESTQLGLKGIPTLAEELQVARDLYILEYTGGKLHIPTISTKNSVSLVAAAKKKGLNITCSVPIHNLIFNDSTLREFNTDFKTLPPLRTKEDCNELIKGVKNGTIDFVTSDHTPLNIELKEVEFDNAANGTIGLESAFGALQTLFDLDTTIALLTKGRENFGIQTPELKEGTAASLTLFEPNTTYEFSMSNIRSTSKNTMFIGKTLKGTVLGTLAKNKLVLNF